jgi:hypothetical protein
MMKKITDWMKISRKNLKILTSSILLLILAACAVKAWQPVSGDYFSEDGYVIVRNDSLQIALRPQSYRGSFQDADSDFFPVYVQVRNLTQARVMIPAGSFSILTGGRQYDYIPVDYVLSNVRDRIYFENWQDPFTEDPLLIEDRERDLDKYYELLSDYFSLGELLPSASKDGYLFYPRAVGKADSLSIDALGHWVHFTLK